MRRFQCQSRQNELINGNESLHIISNDNGVRVVNFATSKNITVNGIMFPHSNIHKYTWTFPDGKTHNQNDHILIERWRHSSVLDQIFWIRQILGKEWEYNEAVHQLFVDFKKAYDSMRREVLYNIHKEFRIPMKLVRLIILCLNETYSKVHKCKHFCDNFPIQNGLKERGALSPLIFNFTLKYAFRKVQVNQVGLKLNRTHQLLSYANNVNLLGDDIDTINRNRNFNWW
jgi:hypothetical protein